MTYEHEFMGPAENAPAARALLENDLDVRTVRADGCWDLAFVCSSRQHLQRKVSTYSAL